MPTQGDVMERKGYYNELVGIFEGFRDKKAEIDKDIEDDLEEKKRIEAKMVDMADDLRALKKQMLASKRAKLVNAKYLADLEAGGLRAMLALRRMQYASVPVEERARDLRQAFNAGLEEAGPVSPHATQKLGATKGVNHMSVVVEDLGFESEEGIEVPVRVFRGNPNTDVAAGPVLVYFHGESYVLGTLDSHDWICRSLAALASVSVVSVGYRQPPEDPFPAAFEDAYRAVCWVADGGLGKVPASVCVGGDSAGGGIALACCLKAKREEGPHIALQVLFYPWLDLRPENPTMEGEDIPFLADLDWFRSVYAPPHEDDVSGDDDEAALNPPDHPLVDGRPWFEDPRASPILAESFKDLPAAFIAYAADDPLAGEAERLAARMLKEAGHEAVHTLHLEGPLGHGFVKRRDKPQAHTVLSAAAAFVSAALRAPISTGSGKSPSKKRSGKSAMAMDLSSKGSSAHSSARS